MPLREALLNVLLALVECETDPREKAAKLAILRASGLLPAEAA